VNNSAFTADWWNWWSVHYGRDHWDYHNDVFKMYIYSNDSTSVTVDIFKDKGMMHGVTRLSSETYAVSSSWWNSVDITFHIQHGGSGRFNGFFNDQIKTGAYVPDLPSDYDGPIGENWFFNFINNLGQAVGNLPNWLRQYMNPFGEWGSWVLTLLNIVISTVLAALPFAPLIFLFYLLDAGITSVSRGSFMPIGDFFMTIYQLTTSFIHVLVAIAHAIYDFVHFW
jgi:hypothetical protein